MNEHLIRIAPLGSVLLLATCCAWPYVSLPDGVEQLSQSNKLPRISRAMITPDFHAAVDRDPFVPVSAGPEAAEEASLLVASPKQFVPVETTPPPVDPLQALSHLKLNATSVYGGRPMALIDGVLREPGDRLALDEFELTCTVREILHDKVVLEHDGALYSVTYPSVFELAAADHGDTAVRRVGNDTKAGPSLWEFIKHQLSKKN